jgi:hypothetical protein
VCDIIARCLEVEQTRCPQQSTSYRAFSDLHAYMRHSRIVHHHGTEKVKQLDRIASKQLVTLEVTHVHAHVEGTQARAPPTYK